MPTSHVASALIWTISLASIALMLLRPRRIAEVYWICGGALLLVTARLLPIRDAARAVYEGLDVYLFLTGMMLLAELAREEGVFDWIADAAARHSRNSPSRLFLLVYIMGAVVTALLSNDATAVVLTPAVLAVGRRVRAEPKPYLLACALVANAASFILPISNPANLVVFGRSIPLLGTWLHIFVLPSLAAMIVTYLCLRWLSRRELSENLIPEIRGVALSFEGKLALIGLIVAAVALVVSSAIGISLGLPTCCAAVFAAALVMWHDVRIPLRIAKGVSWSILPLVACLFVIVEALQHAGLLRFGVTALLTLGQAGAWVAKTGAAFGVGVLSNVMNNLPAGLMSRAAIQYSHNTGIVTHSILVGIDLGPNLSVTGSLATILWLIALRREKVEITSWEFFRVGLIVMPTALLASLLFLWH